MNDSTLKSSVEFGEKVCFFNEEPCSYSTAIHTDDTLLPKSYTAVDFIEKKKMDAYRNLNKKLSGK